MNHKERRQLENFLLTQGLATLADPELIQQLADLVSGWRGDRHQFLQDLLNECDASQRYEMYQAIAPKLKFSALPFPTYECRIAEQAGRMVSQRRMRVEGSAPAPIEVGGQKFAVVPRQDSTNAVATVRCHQCQKVETFIADTPAGAMIAARTMGWVRDPEVNKEMCANCHEIEAEYDA